jgi:hypothetical protein
MTPPDSSPQIGEASPRSRPWWRVWRRRSEGASGKRVDATTDKPRKRIWVQHVDPELQALRVRLAAAKKASNLTDAQLAVADGVGTLIDRAQSAADRTDPIPGRILNWWRGTLVESAYRNLHMARAQILDLYPEPELNAEIPAVIARVHSTLQRDDPRRVSSVDLRALSIEDRRAWLRRLTEDSYDVIDMQHSRLRNFRNIILSAAIVICGLMALAATLMSIWPHWIPLCFPAGDVTAGSTETADVFNCPTARETPDPQRADVIVVGLLGLLGGALATTVAIRKMSGGSPQPYDVPVALAWLKVPLGAFVAILGLVAIRGGFVPGLSRLDSQDQILAYAVLLGFSQQLFTQVLDSKAQALVGELPSKSDAGETKTTSTIIAVTPDGSSQVIRTGATSTTSSTSPNST